MPRRQVSDADRVEMNRHGISEEMYMKYSHKALRTLDIYKQVPRHTQKSTWNKQTLYTNLKPGGEMLHCRHGITPADRTSMDDHGISAEQCSRYSKASLRSLGLYQRVPASYHKSAWSKETLCTTLGAEGAFVRSLVDESPDMETCLQHTKKDLLDRVVYARRLIDKYRGVKRWNKYDICRAALTEHAVERNDSEQKKVRETLETERKEHEGARQSDRDKHRAELRANFVLNRNETWNTDLYLAGRISRLHRDALRIDGLGLHQRDWNLDEKTHLVPVGEGAAGAYNNGIFKFHPRLDIPHTLVKKMRNKYVRGQDAVDDARSMRSAARLNGLAEKNRQFEIAMARKVRDLVVLPKHTPCFAMIGALSHDNMIDKVLADRKRWDYGTVGKYLFFEYGGPQHVFGYIADHIDSPGLPTFLKGVLFEVAVSIYAAQTYVAAFRHNDLHTGNVLVQSGVPVARRYQYFDKTGGLQSRLVTHATQPLIIDYGAGYMKATKDIRGSFHPRAGMTKDTDYIYDMFIFCLYVGDSIQNRADTKSVREILEFLEITTGTFLGKRVDRNKHTIDDLVDGVPLYSRGAHRNCHFIRDFILDHPLFDEFKRGVSTDTTVTVWQIGNNLP